MAMYPNPTSIGEVTGPKIALGSVVIVGMVVAFAAGGVIQTAMNEYFIGMKKTKSYKTIAKRNAVLGGALGAVAVAGMMSA